MKTKRQYAVAYLHNGKLSALIIAHVSGRRARELAEFLNDNLAGSTLIAVVIPVTALNL